MDLYGIVRHGQYDSSTCGLRPIGLEQGELVARRLALHLPWKTPLVIRYGPKLRNRQMAERIAEEYLRVTDQVAVAPVLEADRSLDFVDSWGTDERLSAYRAAAGSAVTYFAGPSQNDRLLLQVTHELMVSYVPYMVHMTCFEQALGQKVPRDYGQGVLMNLGSGQIVTLGTPHGPD